ncbi:MAG: 3-deoxy-7-phosphoheptulonate synthase [Aquificaceae bacterium]|nr:MAG: 3-deoxy-7-phosphoheptulonate synthase [Aquificaceae bacterium]
MTKRQTDNLRIVGTNPVIAPIKLHNDYPLSDYASNIVQDARDEAHNILHGKDDRLLVIVGPCSIHDPKAALEYADQLLGLRDELKDQLHIIMRVYFEKPRTSVGWKGLINDPDLDGSFNINKGLGVARKLLLDLAEKGMPSATEYLDLISPQYIADIIAWGAIGARTTESQGHRELASGVSCPIGFKNGTDGNIGIAINAIEASSQGHGFMSVKKEGHTAIFNTAGNNDCHVILRGGTDGPNYDATYVNNAVHELQEKGLPPYLMVDFSHANSGGKYKNQLKVCSDIAGQISSGSTAINGVMIESHINEGSQNAKGIKKEDLNYAQSITDACIGWDDTETVLRELAQAVEQRNKK